jgi:lipoprotein-releasing system ATP-binding protein
MVPLIRAEGLSKSFRDGSRVVSVLCELDFEVGRGEKVAIVGESGAGKSTLLHILGALERPSGGRVLFDTLDVFAAPDHALGQFRNREVGFVFQFHHLLADFTALENVMMPALIQGLPWDDVRARAQAMLERVGLGERVTHRPGELSGGEQQRVAVARAVMLHPRLILADEPTGNLDRATGDGIHDLLLELNVEHDITLVVVTHNERLAALADRRVRLAGGRLHEEPAIAPGGRPVAVGGGPPTGFPAE